MERILVLLCAPCYADMDGAILNALDNARYPDRISFGLTMQTPPESDEINLMAETGSILYRLGDSPWIQMNDFWQGESMILVGHGDMQFLRHWDVHLLREQRACGKRSVLTGFLPTDFDCVNAVMPVAIDRIDETDHLILTAGTPLRYALRSMRSAFLNPSFCFGPHAFFESLNVEREALFLGAFLNRWELYTMREAWLRMLRRLEPLVVSAENTAAMRDFGRHFGISIEDHTVTAAARTGIMTTDQRVPMHVPVLVRLQERFRALDHPGIAADPLVVSMYLPLQGEKGPDGVQMAAFRRLCGIRKLTLLCYTDAGNLRKLLLTHPNVLEFKRRYGVSANFSLQGENVRRFVQCSSVPVLTHSREKFLEHSHYIWMDFDYLTYPVYERTAIEWEMVCTDRITIAEVNGIPDLSMICVPDNRVLPLNREIQNSFNQLAGQMDCIPAAETLWQRVIHLHPDWFQLIPMPGDRQLFSLTMTSAWEEWKFQ